MNVIHENDQELQRTIGKNFAEEENYGQVNDGVKLA